MQALFRTLSTLLILCTAVNTSVCGQESQNPPNGKWEGKLQLPSTELRIFFQIEETAPGKYRARMASPDQGANNIPVDNVYWKNDSLQLEVKAVGGSYSARLSQDKKQLQGYWKQGGGAIPLVVSKTEVLEFYRKRPQEPAKPYPYKEEEVQYINKAAGNTLGGTLTLPEGSGPFPAVVLISGSGAQNRDSEIMGHKPFLVLADYLTRRGIAVLRVDDRGVGKSTGNAATATSEDNASDVTASFNFLKAHPAIDAKKVGLIGHSEGGMIAPVVASQVPGVAYIVLMAGVGFPGDQLHRRQAEDILRMAKLSEADIQKALAVNDKLYEVIKREKSSVPIEDKLTAIMLQSTSDSAAIAPTVKALSSPWFRYFINFNPVPYLRKVKCPVLAINGSKDIQVSSKENLAAIEKAIKEGGNPNVTIKELEGLNHLFQTAGTGELNEYAKIEETFSPKAMKVIGDWIEARVK